MSSVNDSSELRAAEEQVAEERKALDEALEKSMNEAIAAVQNKIGEETRQVSELLDTGEKKLKEKFAQADHFVQEVGGQFDAVLGEARDVVGKVRASVDETIHQADEVAIRLENVISSIRKDFVQGADVFLGRMERMAQTTRSGLTQATGQITQLMDKAEETMNRVSDPEIFVKDNPRLAISTLLFGGIFLGMFFRRLFVKERSVAPTHRQTVDHKRAA